LTAKRTLGHGCRMRGIGSHCLASRASFSQEHSALWLRRLSSRNHSIPMFRRNASRAREFPGTA
jgi:hypothetical protein